MAFFDELSKRMSGVAQSAQKTAEIARLQRQVTLKQDEFDGLFANIGQLYYNCYKRNVSPDETLDSLCDRVDSLASEIEGLKLKLDDLRQIRRCPNCGNVQNNNSRFCSDCGSRLEIYQEETQTDDQPEEKTEEEPGKNVYINWPQAEDQTAPAEKEDEANENVEEEKE